MGGWVKKAQNSSNFNLGIFETRGGGPQFFKNIWILNDILEHIGEEEKIRPAISYQTETARQLPEHLQLLWEPVLQRVLHRYGCARADTGNKILQF